MHDVAYSINDAQRIPGGPDFIDHVFDGADRRLREWKINDRGPWFFQRSVRPIRADSNDLDLASRAYERHNEALAQRALAAKPGVHERLIHNRNQRRSGSIVLIKIAAEQDWNLHIREKARADL